MIAKTTGKALVLGFGASGQAAARLLRRQGHDVVVADEKIESAGDFELVHELAPELVDALTLAVVSPGVAAHHPWLKKLHAAGVRVVPEFELGLGALPDARVIAVTGSNGKSSLVKWIAGTLSLAGKHAVPAGNYGLPVCELALEKEAPEFIVLELSSFQLEQAADFHPEIAIMVNFTPNHLDRHGTMEVYAKAKMKMFSAHARPGVSIFHAPAWRELKELAAPDITPVLFGREAKLDFTAVEGRVLRRGQQWCDFSGTWWSLSPQIVNAAAACAVFDRLDIPREIVREAAMEFQPLPHRMQLLTVWKGIHVVNDAKCSSLTALAAAVASYAGRKHVIAGGVLKETDPGLIKQVLVDHDVVVYLIGVAAPVLYDAWQDRVPCELCSTLERAVPLAMKRACAGERVLFSPGCASFDQFGGYAERGEKFKQLVQECTGQSC
jgi:UDP-N-acetylmuramoylalanine--D-glutamate ligase